MAEQGKKISEDDRRRIMRLSQVIRSRTEIARMAGVSRPTVYKYAPLPPAEKRSLAPFTDEWNSDL